MGVPISRLQNTTNTMLLETESCSGNIRHGLPAGLNKEVFRTDSVEEKAAAEVDIRGIPWNKSPRPPYYRRLIDFTILEKAPPHCSPPVSLLYGSLCFAPLVRLSPLVSLLFLTRGGELRNSTEGNSVLLPPPLLPEGP